jgi:REP element-mobilizing transposase RayT
MDKIRSLNHTKWECNYNIVFIPKCRRKVFYGQLKRELPELFHELARHKECRIEEGHMMGDHVHMLISIPPKYSVSQPDFDTDWAHVRKIPNEFNGLTWIFCEMPRYMDC